MATGVTQARRLGMRAIACASTGNTSASLAAYASRAGLLAIVLVPEGQISFGKLSQALDFGALTLQLRGDFDDAQSLLMEIAPQLDIYILNSVNPFRLEGSEVGDPRAVGAVRLAGARPYCGAWGQPGQ